MLPIRPDFCFYLDSHNNWYVPLRTWVDSVNKRIGYTGGGQDLVGRPLPPGLYLDLLTRHLQHVIEHPPLDTIPDIFDMKPANDNVLIKQLPPDEVTKGGIIIPPAVQATSLVGVVLAVGPGQYNRTTGKPDPMTAKEGDTVLFDKFAGTPCIQNGQESLIMAERFILGYL